jgi:DNA-binding HxlR family transcriptional regulator
VRSYGQYCALAKALDVVGERWSLLIVRELLSRPCRYRDLQDGLPGVATNLLAERLRDLAGAGVVGRDDEGRYVLTPWGEQLAEALNALARWGSPLMDEMGPDESFRSHWLALPISFIFAGVDPRRPPLVVEIRAGGPPVTMVSAHGEVRSHPGMASSPDLVLSGPPDAIVGLLAGRLDKKAATSLGVIVLGDIRPLARLRRADWWAGPETSRVKT